MFWRPSHDWLKQRSGMLTNWERPHGWWKEEMKDVSAMLYYGRFLCVINLFIIVHVRNFCMIIFPLIKQAQFELPCRVFVIYIGRFWTKIKSVFHSELQSWHLLQDKTHLASPLCAQFMHYKQRLHNHIIIFAAHYSSQFPNCEFFTTA
jgi:hypothetical protein